MRISTGVTVNVSAQVERWFSELRAGRAFSGVGALAAAAGTVSEIQLFNPAGSAITLLLYKCVGDATVASALQLRTFNTALATLIGNGLNMLSGGAASVAEIRSAAPAVNDGTSFWSKAALAGEPIELGDLWVIELGAGEGVIATDNTQNVGVRFTFLWNEA